LTVRLAIDRIFVLLFAAILAAPLLQMATHLVHEPQVEELRRPRTIAAPLARLVVLDPRLSDDVNGWFNDHYGFRSVLIRLKNEIDYQLFKTSDKVLIGRDGWLFDKALADDIVKDAADPALDQQIISAMRDLRDCLARRDVRLVVVLNSTKTTIYARYLRERLPVDPPPRLAPRLAQTLRHEPGLTFIDGERILAEHSDEDLFYKTDLHFNLKGAALVYRQMLAQIAEAVDRPPPQIAPETLSAIDWNGGSEARFLAKFLPLKNISYIDPHSSPAFTDNDNGTFERNVPVSGLPKVTFDVFRTKRPQAALLPPMLIFGTSFSDYIFALRYNELFETVYQTRAETPGDIVPLLGHLPDDVKIFLLEMPEPFLSRIASMDPSPNCTAAHPSASDAPRQRRP
jgi:SGNH hydrolase-like domain, acetyltransferase AlgX